LARAVLEALGSSWGGRTAVVPPAERGPKWVCSMSRTGDAGFSFVVTIDCRVIVGVSERVRRVGARKQRD
jgi:hypothetical protein